MATFPITSAIPADEMADLEEVSRLISEGKPVTDPALLSASTSGPRRSSGGFGSSTVSSSGLST